MTEHKGLAHFPTKKIILPLMFLFLISFCFAGSYVTFNETFGTSAFFINKTMKPLTNYPLCYVPNATSPQKVNRFDLNLLKQNRNNLTINGKTYYCFRSITGGGLLQRFNYQNTTQSARYHSKQGVTWYDDTSTPGTAMPSGIYFPLNFSDFSISENSFIKFYVYQTGDGVSNSYGQGLGFVDKTGKIVEYIELANKSCSSSTFNATYCRRANYGSSYDHLSRYLQFNRIRLNGTYLNNINSSMSFTNIDGFFISYIGGSSDGSVSVSIDDISMRFINGSNSLPSVNISFSNACINGTNPAQINVTTSAYDPEGDTIYYANNYNQASNENQTVGFNFNNGLWDRPNWDFYDSVYNPDLTYCTINRNSEAYTNLTQHNLYLYTYQHNFFLESSAYMLRLDSICTGRPEFVYTLPTALNDIQLVTRFYNLNSNTDELNLTLYGQGFNVISRVGFKVNTTDNAIYVYSYNSTMNKKAELTTGVLDNYHDFPITFTSFGNTTSWVYYNYAPYGSQITKFSVEPIKYIGFSSKDTLFIPEFKYTGVYSTLNFTTNPFSDFTVSNIGRYRLRYFISDSVHKPSEYESYTKTLYVPDCKYSTIGSNPANSETLSGCNGFDPICMLNIFLGKPFREYMQDVDSNHYAQVIIWWAYLVLFLAAIWTEYKFTRHVDIVIPLLSSSGLILFISLLGGYVASIIVSIVGLALGLMSMFSKPFAGGSRNE